MYKCVCAFYVTLTQLLGKLLKVNNVLTGLINAEHLRQCVNTKSKQVFNQITPLWALATMCNDNLNSSSLKIQRRCLLVRARKHDSDWFNFEQSNQVCFLYLSRVHLFTKKWLIINNLNLLTINFLSAGKNTTIVVM